MRGIAAMGEVMIELAPHDKGLLRLGYAGDTYNTAIYLARHGVPTSYYTRLGLDLHSEAILAALAAESVNTALIERDGSRQPGLYMINNRPDGEREFSYWRSQSAARLLLSQAPAPAALFEHAVIYLSGITLAIMEPQARATLKAKLQDYRARGGKVAFDSNYRPRLWADAGQAQACISEFLAITDLALLTLDDEQLLWGDSDPQQSADRLMALGLPELVLKRGAEPALASLAGQSWQPCPVVPVDQVVDTTAAGDSFNAGYLAARLQGVDCADAVLSGALCAGAVIQHRGAIVERTAYEASRQQLAGRA